MPELIQVYDFIASAKEDYDSPTTSTFCKSTIPQCRHTLQVLDEVSEVFVLYS